MGINWRLFREEVDVIWLIVHLATLTAKWELDCKRLRGWNEGPVRKLLQWLSERWYGSGASSEKERRYIGEMNRWFRWEALKRSRSHHIQWKIVTVEFCWKIPPSAHQSKFYRMTDRIVQTTLTLSIFTRVGNTD